MGSSKEEELNRKTDFKGALKLPLGRYINNISGFKWLDLSAFPLNCMLQSFSMKKLFLFTAALAAFSTVQAQELKAPAKITLGVSEAGTLYNDVNARVNTQQKTAAQTDTGYFTYNTFLPKGFSNIYSRRIFDSSVAYRLDAATPNDSGYIFGTNPLISRGVAEQFHFRYKTDTGMLILGFRTAFSGHVQSTSTRTISFNMWKRAIETPDGTKTYNSGLPGTSIVSLSVPVTRLGISNAGNGADSLKNFFFASPQTLATADSDFFMGYTMPTYSWAGMMDTFAMRSSRSGSFTGVGSYLRGTDTVNRNQNVVMNANGTWVDQYWDYTTAQLNFSILPIVKLTGSLSVDNSFTANDLTFFGNYPNPASDRTTIKFSLQVATTVSLVITDLNGRTIRTEPAQKLGAGIQEMSLNVSDLAAGNYVYVLTSANGGAIASQLTVIR
ncbi:MAG: T9SS type A sorting domain-containing protein [Sphingobacteriales bacterium]|nr:MAG: T9SS type A sorting domain-containing protein [Sphingobacteriales bacterium]